jgi:uncharacterized membrane protein YGL010W
MEDLKKQLTFSLILNALIALSEVLFVVGWDTFVLKKVKQKVLVFD